MKSFETPRRVLATALLSAGALACSPAEQQLSDAGHFNTDGLGGAEPQVPELAHPPAQELRRYDKSEEIIDRDCETEIADEQNIRGISEDISLTPNLGCEISFDFKDLDKREDIFRYLGGYAACNNVMIEEIEAVVGNEDEYGFRTYFEDKKSLESSRGVMEAYKIAYGLAVKNPNNSSLSPMDIINKVNGYNDDLVLQSHSYQSAIEESGLASVCTEDSGGDLTIRMLAEEQAQIVRSVKI